MGGHALKNTYIERKNTEELNVIVQKQLTVIWIY